MSVQKTAERLLKGIYGESLQFDLAGGAEGQNLLKTVKGDGNYVNQLSLHPQATLELRNVELMQTHAAVPSSNQCLFWAPFGLSTSGTTTVASSRLGKRLPQSTGIAEALRTLFAGMPKNTSIISSPGTTLDKLVRRACRWFSVPMIVLIPGPKSFGPKWVRQSMLLHDNALRENFGTPVYFFTSSSEVSESTDDGTVPSEPAVSASRRTGNPRDRAIVDQIMFSIADEVRVMYVREDGNIHRLTQDRLRLLGPERAKVYLFIDKDLNDLKLKNELIDSGGRGWWLYDQKNSETDLQDNLSNEQESRSLKKQHSTAAAKIISLGELTESDFLSHCTRSPQDCWPDETIEDHWDEFLFGGIADQRTALSTLVRIVSSQRLLSGGGLIRHSQRVISFTEIPIGQLFQHRKYRSHLARWDFEPFGIAVKRDSLIQKAGAKPVQYGGDELWAKLDRSEQPYFQFSSASGDSESIDWRCEREWRIVGDLDLRLFSVDEAVVFVGDRKSAEMVAPISRWPIAVIERVGKSQRKPNRFRESHKWYT